MVTYNSIFNPEEMDPQFKDVVEFVIKTQQASATVIQRHFKIGYARAARLLDELESFHVVGPVNGAKPRVILIKSFDEIDTNKLPKLKEDENIPKLNWKKTIDLTKGFLVDLGKDNANKELNIDMDRYGNLMIIGSQMTSIGELTNQIIAQEVEKNSPDDLKLILIDGFINQIEYPYGGPHLLTPVITDTQKVEAAIIWLQGEVVRRLQSENKSEKQPKILLVINGFNESIIFSADETEFRIGYIMKLGKSVGVHIITTFDYVTPNLSKEILANNGAKIVFKPTTRQMARSSGVFESIELESPDEAILETMFEEKTKFTINKINVRKVYGEIFE